MANFLFVYRHDGVTASDFDKRPPEERQQHMQKRETWIKEGLDEGWMLNPGDALKKEGRVVNAKKMVTDGPFIEAKEIVGGFSVVQADTIDAATEIAKGCPCLLTGGKVEVRPMEGFTLGR